MNIELPTDQFKGLGTGEVSGLQGRFGLNELPQGKAKSVLSLLREIFSEPMFLLLAGSSALYFFLGDKTEGLLLMASMGFIVVLTVIQEYRTDHALKALKDLSSPRASVIRDGLTRRVPGHDLVPGDLVILSEGDRVPADARLLWTSHLQVDESLLTGESVPVAKTSSSDEKQTPEKFQVFSGTLVVRGQALVRVTETGVRTRMGGIGKSLESIVQERTTLEKDVNRLVFYFLVVGIFLCLVIVAAHGLKGAWLKGLLAGLTTAMSVLPEEFPVVLIIFFAMGAWKMSKKHVLVRRLPVLETLGTTDVLCVDKTGTITLNEMALKVLGTEDREVSIETPKPGIEEPFHELLEYAVLASHRDPFDPTEKAIRTGGLECLKGTEHLHSDWELVREYPLSSHLLAMSCVWLSPEGEDYCIASKGAPEAVMDLCHFSDAQTRFWSEKVNDLSSRGLRVLAVAKAFFKKGKLPSDQHDFVFSWVGLLALKDPVRPGVPEAVKTAHRAGVRVIMITGDHAGTALHIGREIGLTQTQNPLSGSEIESLNDEALHVRLQACSIVARATPDHKLRIVKLLKQMGHVVSMTGDGVNDAPALKAADIGIAMGGRGTDVAREAAHLVLTDDNFNSIIEAIQAGRGIEGNLRKAFAYLLAIHIPIAGLALFPVLMGLPMALFPVHIVFLELIIDPTCSLVFESIKPGAEVMSRPPRTKSDTLLNLRLILLSLVQGFVPMVLAVALYAFLLQKQSETVARTYAFLVLVSSNLGLILVNHSWRHYFLHVFKEGNKMIWMTMILILGSLLALTTIPVMARLFGLAALGLPAWFGAVGLGLTSVMWFEAIKKRQLSSA